MIKSKNQANKILKEKIPIKNNLKKEIEEDSMTDTLVLESKLSVTDIKEDLEKEMKQKTNRIKKN